LKIEVKPSADLSRLEEVLVVTEKQEENAVAESGVRVRAADILAQRLPSVPEKPVADAAAEAAGGSGSGKPVASAQETSTGTQPLTPAESSVKPEAAPHVAPTASTAKITGSGATATTPAKATVGSSGSSQSVPVSGQTVNGQAPKKTTPKPPSGDPALNKGSQAASNAAAVRPPKSANEPPKPAVTPKSQPATEDDPH
jgi:hypothetical protein